jgi:hypothetical protein
MPVRRAGAPVQSRLHLVSLALSRAKLHARLDCQMSRQLRFGKPAVSGRGPELHQSAPYSPTSRSLAGTSSALASLRS